MRFLPVFLLLGLTLRADPAPLLDDVARRWAAERDQWSFTQLVREYDGDKVTEERLERFDLTRGESRRWELVKVNGRPPTTEQEAAWSKRKNRPRKREPKPLTEYIDIAHARVVQEDAHHVSYEVPLRPTADWLFPSDKVDVMVTINKQSREIERGRLAIDGPFKVALGLARVVDLDFDLAVAPDGRKPAADGSQEAQGTAYAVVNKLGRRVEYSWSDFSRNPASAPR